MGVSSHLRFPMTPICFRMTLWPYGFGLCKTPARCLLLSNKSLGFMVHFRYVIGLRQDHSFGFFRIRIG